MNLPTQVYVCIFGVVFGAPLLLGLAAFAWPRLGWWSLAYVAIILVLFVAVCVQWRGYRRPPPGP